MVLPLTGFTCKPPCRLRSHPICFPTLPLFFALVWELPRHTQMPLHPSGSTATELCRHGIGDYSYHSILCQHVVSTHELWTLRIAKSQIRSFPDFLEVSFSFRSRSAKMHETLGKRTTRTPPHMSRLWSTLETLVPAIKVVMPTSECDILDRQSSASRTNCYNLHPSPRNWQGIQATRPTRLIRLHSTPDSCLSPYLPSTTGG